MIQELIVLTGLALLPLACSGTDSPARAGTADGGVAATGGASGAVGGAKSSGGTSGGATGGAAGSGGATTPPMSGAVTTFGKPYTGGLYHLGPVDYDETQWHNACAPGTKYSPAVRRVEGTLLAGLWGGIPDVAGYCDACILVTTAKGKSAVLRVVTYGVTTTNSIDVSPDAYALLNVGENPRDMTWQLAECPATGNVMYEFQTGANEWWTSLWVRNARVPLAKVEVQSKNHPSWAPLSRGTDGTLTDASGFGNGPFSIRLTGIDGRVLVDQLAWPSAGIAGQTLTGKANFD
jgi:expansin